MQAALGLLQVKFSPAPDNIFLVFQVVLQNLLEAQNLWCPVDNRQHVEVEGRLHQGHLVQVIQDYLGAGVPPHVNYNPHPIPVGFIVNVGDSVNFLIPGQVGNPAN